jgi:hypothetical protein
MFIIRLGDCTQDCNPCINQQSKILLVFFEAVPENDANQHPSEGVIEGL